MTIDRAHVLATPGMDRHSTYVGMSRHRDAPALHYGRDDFANRGGLSARCRASGARSWPTTMRVKAANNVTVIAQRVYILAKRPALASARRGDEQNRWLAGAGVGGVIVGMALWVAFAGPIARAMPESWLWPERMAARAVDRSMWDAGQRLMTVANPETCRAIVAGDQIVRANQDTIEQCRKAAAKAKSRYDARSG